MKLKNHKLLKIQKIIKLSEFLHHKNLKKWDTKSDPMNQLTKDSLSYTNTTLILRIRN